MRLLYLKEIIVITLILLTGNLYSEDYDITPIKRGDRIIPKEMGLLFGVGPALQGGSFFSSCPCEFFDGRGARYALGAFYEAEIIRDLRLGISGLLYFQNLKASYLEKETVDVFSEENVRVSSANISVEHVGKVDLFSIGAAPFIKWYLSDYFFLKTAFSVSYIAGADLEHTQQFMQRTVKLSDNKIGIIKDAYGNPVSSEPIILEKTSYPNINALQMSIQPMFGFDVPLSQAFSISPMVQYSLPLTTISKTGENFKISSWMFILELRHTLINYVRDEK